MNPADYYNSADFDRALWEQLHAFHGPFAMLKGRPLGAHRRKNTITWDGATGCWEWHGGRMAEGYGAIMVDRRVQYVHRLVYQAVEGSIPRGLVLDHLCRNRACCRPSHLEPVSIAENLRRGREVH